MRCDNLTKNGEKKLASVSKIVVVFFTNSVHFILEDIQCQLKTCIHVI